jgi:hypothetical protein
LIELENGDRRICVDIAGASSIAESTREAHAIAVACGMPVTFEFNGLEVVVSPGDDPEVTWRTWWKEKHGETPEQTQARR